MAGRNSSLYETSYIQYSPEQYTYSMKRTYNTALLIDHEVRLEKRLAARAIEPASSYHTVPCLLDPWQATDARDKERYWQTATDEPRV